MKIDEWKGSSVWYKIGCDCGDSDCDFTIEFEYDKDFGYIDMNFYKNIKAADYYYDTFLGRCWFRIKSAACILIKGELKTEGNLLIRNEEHIDSIIEAFQEGKNKIINFKEEIKNEIPNRFCE